MHVPRQNAGVNAKGPGASAPNPVCWVSVLGVGGRWWLVGCGVSRVSQRQERVDSCVGVSGSPGPSGTVFRYPLACKDQPRGLTRWVG